MRLRMKSSMMIVVGREPEMVRMTSHRRRIGGRGRKFRWRMFRRFEFFLEKSGDCIGVRDFSSFNWIHGVHSTHTLFALCRGGFLGWSAWFLLLCAVSFSGCRGCGGLGWAAGFLFRFSIFVSFGLVDDFVEAALALGSAFVVVACFLASG